MRLWRSPLFRNYLIILNIFIMTEFDDCSMVAETSDDSWFLCRYFSFWKCLLSTIHLKWRCCLILESILVWCKTLNITTRSSVYQKIVLARIRREFLSSHCEKLESLEHCRIPDCSIQLTLSWAAWDGKLLENSIKKTLKNKAATWLWPTSTYVQ